MFPLVVCCQILINVNLIRGTESKINAGKYRSNSCCLRKSSLRVERMALIDPYPEERESRSKIPY